MSWRKRYLQVEDDLSLADSGTKTFDLNIDEPITALDLRFKIRNSSSAVKEQPPENYITKVEIIDGGTVYDSLSGPQLVAQAVYGLGHWPRHFYDERANNNQRIHAPLLFGRWLDDEEYAFNPRLLTNPQLRFTWSDNSNYADGYYTLGITAHLLEGLTPPRQMITWKEIEAWTTASSGVHKTEIPMDFPYRGLMIRNYADGAIPYLTHTHFKLDIDNSKYIPLDLDTDEFRDLTRAEFGPYQAFYHLVESNNVQVNSWIGETLAAQGSHQTTPPSTIALYSAGAWPLFVVYGADAGGGAITDALIEATAQGYYPHNCYLWPFGGWYDPALWLDPRLYKTIDLKLTEGVADIAASIVGIQARTMP